MEKLERSKLSSIHANEIIGQIPNELLILFVVGFADGVLIRRISERFSNPLFRMVIWEPDAVFFDIVCRENDISDVTESDKVFIVTGTGTESEVAIENLVEREIQVYNNSLCAVIAMPGFEGLYGQQFTFLNTIVEKKQHHIRVGLKSVQLSTSQQCLNMLQALSQFQDNYTISGFFDSIPTRDVPVIIVAAGPSLAKNVHLLKKAYGKAIIVVLAHAAKVVYENGCDIDILAVKEGSVGQSFLDYEKASDALIIMRVMSARDLQKKYNGKIVYYGFDRSLFFVRETEYQYTSERESGSVAGDVFYMFAAAGFKRFILIGQDLAYDKNGYTHAGKEKEKGIDGDIIKAEGIHGEEVFTRSDWQIMREYYEFYIKTNPDIDVIDATEGGAKIHGTRIMKFEDALEQVCKKEYPVRSWMEKIERTMEKEDIYRVFKRHCDATVLTESRVRQVLSLNIEALDTIGSDDVMTNKHIVDVYDKEFVALLHEDEAKLLWLYSQDVVMNFLSECMMVERKGNTKEKIRFEGMFLEQLLTASRELIDNLRAYME